MNLSIYRYKPDQAHLVRGIAFWLPTALIFYGCRTLYFFLHWEWAKTPLIDWVIPVVNLPVDGTLIVSIAVFIAAEIVLVKVINSIKFGTLLIETETEMKKVTWPSWNDALQSSFVVLFGVIFFMAFLAVADIVLSFIFTKIVFGG